MDRKLRAFNIGLEIFYESLLEQGAEVVDVRIQEGVIKDERLRKFLDEIS